MNATCDLSFAALTASTAERRAAYRFDLACEDMHRRLADWRTLEKRPAAGQRVGFVLTSWLQTAVPFFNLELACEMRRQGCEVVILLDLADMVVNRNAYTDDENTLLERLAAEAGKDFRVIRVGQGTGEPSTEQLAAWQEVAFENAVWTTRGDDLAREFLREHPDLPARLARHEGAVEAALDEAGPLDWIFCPGGAFGLSSVYIEVIKRRGLSYSTYDSGPLLLSACLDGVTGFLDDLPVVHQRVWEQCRRHPQVMEFIRQEAMGCMNQRRRGDDEWAFNRGSHAPEGAAPFDLVIFLNFRADTAALLRHDAFPSIGEWLERTARWACEHKMRLAVRQHPCERIEEFRGRDDHRPLLEKIDPAGEWITFIGSEELIDSYALMEGARAVLPFTSQVGIEATMLGKPVILGTLCYYRPMGFVYEASTPEEYFAHLERACAGQLTVDAERTDRALLGYYLLNYCLWLQGPFTPQPEDFVTWAGVEPAELWNRPECRLLSDTLRRREPVALGRWRELLTEAGLDPGV